MSSRQNKDKRLAKEQLQTPPLDKIEESESETSDSDVKNSDYLSGSSATGSRLRAKGSQIRT
jgi:hypothetical protein